MNIDVAIEIHDLTVSYDKKPVIWNVDLFYPKGKMIGIVGPNGAGKSTLLKSMMGLLPLASGYVKIFDKELKETKDKISYVPQRDSVDWDFPISVFDLVLMGRYGKLGLFSRPKKEDKKKAMEALEKVGMEKFHKRQISELSGGQQQRIFLARSLAQEAEIYFLDEPFAGVDATTEKTIFKLLQNLTKEGKTVIVVHHDLKSVIEFFDWVTLLNTRLIANGSLSEVFTHENLKDTYGGKLTIMSEVSQLIKNTEIPSREAK